MEDLKIIIADDNKGIAEQYKNYIENNSSYKVMDIALSSKDEIEMIEKFSPDVIITDYIRKDEDISGLDIILNCEKNKLNTKFILITGYSYSDIFLKCERRIPNNIINYISKPFSDWNCLIKSLENV